VIYVPLDTPVAVSSQLRAFLSTASIHGLAVIKAERTQPNGEEDSCY
jgi:hypothetical protein